MSGGDVDAVVELAIELRDHIRKHPQRRVFGLETHKLLNRADRVLADYGAQLEPQQHDEED
jgi:hypothetical protein